METKGRARALLPPSKTKAEVAALRAPRVLQLQLIFFSTVAATFKFGISSFSLLLLFRALELDDASDHVSQAREDH